MQRRWTWMLLILIALAAFWGCSSDDDDNPVTPGKTAFETMAEAGAAYVNGGSCPGILTADIVHDNLASYTVIDIRAESAYLAGHIPGAYWSSLGTLVADIEGGSIPTDKPFVVTCYSGQSAGHAKIALSLLGYEAYSLKFGMCGWSSTTRGSWDNATINADNAARNQLASPETDGNNDGLTTHDFPVLTESAATVVHDRVAAMLTAGFKSITYATVSANPDQYFIINYFGAADYSGTGSYGAPGHIPGAYQYTPAASLAMDQMLPNIPTDMPVVVYCWTGQTSSQITAYLNMLGYEAYSLSYGSNILFYDSLSGNKWTDASYRDFELEVGSMPTPAFAAVAEAGAAYVNGGTCPGVILASTVHDNLDAYTVIDIRAADAYNAGHIPGAVNSSLGTLVADLTNGNIPTGKPYVVTCYSGQSAGHAKIAMEMLGYDVYSLKFGMCSWNSTTRGSWDNATINADNAARNQLTNPETDGNNDALVGHAFPELAGDAGSAVATAVDGMLAAGFKSIPYSTVALNPDDYFIINYFGEADYLGTGTWGTPGHIPGAYQFTPAASMAWDEMLPYIPADMPVVVYCWTGQTSSQITAYLNMLGYEAYSLSYGSNILFYDSLTGNKWTSGAYSDFDLEPTPTF
jgi:rhodanese-related sulfurtransferase